MGVLPSLAISHQIMTWHSHLGSWDGILIFVTKPSDVIFVWFYHRETTNLKNSARDAEKVRLMMMINMILLSKIGWPSVGGVWGASANNATGCLTHSRTHSRTHCSNQVLESQSDWICWWSITSFPGCDDIDYDDIYDKQAASRTHARTHTRTHALQ